MGRIGMAALAGLGVVGCGGDESSGVADAGASDAAIDALVDAFFYPPPFRNPADLDDATLATQATTLMGVGTRDKCAACHSLIQPTFREWNELTKASLAACFTNLMPLTQAEATTIVNCLRSETDGKWYPRELGINAIAAGLSWFEYVFRLAYGDSWEPRFAEWKTRVEMPRGDHAKFTQAQFDVVSAWFARELPNLDWIVPAEPPPPVCESDISEDLLDHVAAMRTTGWRALNRDQGLLMHDCQGASVPVNCLQSYPLASASEWGTGWAADQTAIRVLDEISYTSSYWTRSSADGRFVAHGGSAGGAGSTIIDLGREGLQIPADASYDPGFLPDNSGFAFWGATLSFCRQSLLSTATAVTFTEDECNAVEGLETYQHLGAVSGGDFWAINGASTTDPGYGPDPNAAFGMTAENKLTPLIYNGSNYVPREQVYVTTPYAGDAVLSPSTKLMVSRLANEAQQQAGFVVRKLTTTLVGGTYTASVQKVATYCGKRGGKPAFSFDERWLVYHHYVDATDWGSLGYDSADDAEFAALVQNGAANLFLLDLTTGLERRITTMKPGQFALFPHFRSDGWIYAIVKDRGRSVEIPPTEKGGLPTLVIPEVVIASDAALVFEPAAP